MLVASGGIRYYDRAVCWWPQAARHNYSDNRILHLMAWDMISFFGSFALFVAILFVLAWQQASDEAMAAAADAMSLEEQALVGMEASVVASMAASAAEAATEASAVASAVSTPAPAGGSGPGGGPGGGLLGVLLSSTFWAGWRVEVLIVWHRTHRTPALWAPPHRTLLRYPIGPHQKRTT